MRENKRRKIPKIVVTLVAPLAHATRSDQKLPQKSLKLPRYNWMQFSLIMVGKLKLWNLNCRTCPSGKLIR